MRSSSVGAWRGDIHFEAGVLPWQTRRTGLAAVQLGDGGHEREPERGAAVSRPRWVGAIERLEQVRQVGGGYPGAAVFYRHAHTGGSEWLQLDANRFALRRMAHCVLEQVIDQASDKPRIHRDHSGIAIISVRDGNAALLE